MPKTSVKMRHEGDTGDRMTKKNRNGIWTVLISGVVAVVIILTFFLSRVENIKGEARQSTEVGINAMKVPKIEEKVENHSKKIAVLEEGVDNIKKEIGEVKVLQVETNKNVIELLKRR